MEEVMREMPREISGSSILIDDVSLAAITVIPSGSSRIGSICCVRDLCRRSSRMKRVEH